MAFLPRFNLARRGRAEKILEETVAEYEDGLVIMSSEAGAVSVDERRIVRKGRLRPGETLAETPDAARLPELASPILTADDLAALRSLAKRDAARFGHLRAATVDCTWPITEGETGLRRACAQAVAAVCAGHTLRSE